MKKINIIDGIIANIDERGYAEISISDTITEIPIDIDDESYCYDDDRYYTSCIADFIEQNSIKNVKIIGGGENLKDISNLFTFCNINELDLSSFNTSNVTSMFSMFYYARVKHINMSGLFNTSHVSNMGCMFDGCNVEKLDLSSFNTSNVRNMQRMFAGCENLEKLDLSSFNTSNVRNMRGMFNNCINLKNIDLSNFTAENLIDAENMFTKCEKLKSINLRISVYQKLKQQNVCLQNVQTCKQ